MTEIYYFSISVSRDFMTSIPTEKSSDLDGILIYKLSYSQNVFTFFLPMFQYHNNLVKI